MPGETEGLRNQTGDLDVDKEEAHAGAYRAAVVGIPFRVEVRGPLADWLPSALVLCVHLNKTLCCFINTYSSLFS